VPSRVLPLGSQFVPVLPFACAAILLASQHPFSVSRTTTMDSMVKSFPWPGVVVFPALIVGFDENRACLKRLKPRHRRLPEPYRSMKPDVFLGPLSHREWVAVHLRHAELHLGFFIPELRGVAS
jgi:hypothetical protein